MNDRVCYSISLWRDRNSVLKLIYRTTFSVPGWIKDPGRPVTVFKNHHFYTLNSTLNRNVILLLHFAFVIMFESYLRCQLAVNLPVKGQI